MEALVEQGVEELRVDVDGAEDLLGRAEGLNHVIGPVGDEEQGLHEGQKGSL